MRIRKPRTALLLAGLFAVSIAAATAGAAEFPLKDGDTWVMAGDSITAQHLHSNYYEAFCYARFPKKTFRFRNSGIGGDTILKVLARFEYDVAVWKPTVVSVELGMNDQGGFSTEMFLANMAELDSRIRSVDARPVYFTPSPINNGDTSTKIGGNAKLDAFSKGLKDFAAEKDAAFADQFHAVLDLWGKNKSRENIANALPALRVAVQDDGIDGVEHLRAFLYAQGQGSRKLVSMMGDPVHPGPTGQLTMAAALFKGLGGEELVSLAALDASGKVLQAEHCTVEGVKSEDGKLSFDRTDESIPFPIPDDARPVLALDPTVLRLSQFLIRVEGLKAGRYTLHIDGQDAGTLDASTLQVGVNLTRLDKGPLADQGRQVLVAINHKEGLVGQFRQLAKAVAHSDVKAEEKDRFERTRKEIEEADAKIREAAAPKTHHYELTPAS